MQACKICHRKKYKKVQNCDKKVKPKNNQPISKGDSGSLEKRLHNQSSEKNISTYR